MDMLLDDGIAPTTFPPSEEPSAVLSYDDTVPYEAQVEPDTDHSATGSSLANRIGRGKVYLLSESAAAGSAVGRATGKRQAVDDPEDEAAMIEDDDTEMDPELRPNALFFTGLPIAHLPTTRIFAYATHFEAHPLGLEWISDTTCVLVFPSKASARKAYDALSKTPGEEPSTEDGTVPARTIPVTLWPAENRISQTLGLDLGRPSAAQGDRRRDGLSAPLRMRWARIGDVKKKGARKESEFYKKHGELAGKELVHGRDIPSIPGSRKRRRDDSENDEITRARLDQELDAFLAEDRSDEDGEGMDAGRAEQPQESLASRLSGGDRLYPDNLPNREEELSDSPPASPPSKMRSDYIADDGRTVLQRPSKPRRSDVGRFDSRKRGRGGRGRRHEPDLFADSGNGGNLITRIRTDSDEDRGRLEWGPERKRRRDDGSGGGRDWDRGVRASNGGDTGERRPGRNERPKKTQQELDDELDAFLNDGTR